MAFKRYTSRGIGTVPVTVGSYVVAANTATTIIGLTISNTIEEPIDVEVNLVDTSNNHTSIVTNAPVPIGSTLIIVGGSQKVVMETGDFIQISSSANNSIDSVMSILEVDQ